MDIELELSVCLPQRSKEGARRAFVAPGFFMSAVVLIDPIL
jgi:hypothetical protein